MLDFIVINLLNEPPRSKLSRYLNEYSFFITHQDAGNKTHEIPRLSLGISSAI
jgi:hypothetical protein